VPAHIDHIRGTITKMLSGTRIALCVTGSSAAYRSVDLARLLIRHGADVVPVMTGAAAGLVGPELLRWATGNRPVTELTGELEHVELGGDGPGSASVIVVAPATATTISEIAVGGASNPVTAVVNVALGAGKRVIVVPAMHEQMYRNPAVVRALGELESIGISIVQPSLEEGKAKMAPAEEILESVIASLRPKSLRGMKALVTAGPTLERLDPIRVITNGGSGKTGAYVAWELMDRGAEVAVIVGPSDVRMPREARVIRVETTEEMAAAATRLIDDFRPDFAVATASPADFRPERTAEGKIPTGNGPLDVRLVPTPKVVDAISSGGIPVLAFRAIHGHMDDEEMALEGRNYLREHPGALAVAVNNVSEKGMGFGSDYNRIVLVSRDRAEPLPPLHKRAMAAHLVDFLESLGIGRR